MKKIIIIIVSILVLLAGGASVYAASQKRQEANKLLEVVQDSSSIETADENNIASQAELWKNLLDNADNTLSDINSLNLQYIDDDKISQIKLFYSNLQSSVAEVIFYNAMVQTKNKLQVQNQTKTLTKSQAQEMLRELTNIGQLTQGYSLPTEYNSFVGNSSELNKFQKLLEQKTADATSSSNIEIDESELYQYLNQFSQKLLTSINEKVQARQMAVERLQIISTAWIASPISLVVQSKNSQQTQDRNNGDDTDQLNNQNRSNGVNNGATQQAVTPEDSNIETETEQNRNDGDTQNVEQEQNQNQNQSSGSTDNNICGDGICRNNETQSTCNEDCN